MILETLTTDLYNAQKQKDAQKLLVLRYLLSQIKNREIELRVEKKDVTDEDSLLVIKRQVKKRKQAIEDYKRGNRLDLVEKESAELVIVESYFDTFSKAVILS